MPNGNEFISELDLEQRIKGMDDRQLLEFTARQTYENCQVITTNTKSIEKHDKRITALESRKNKTTGLWAGAGTFVGAAIVSVINFFANRGA